VVGESFFVGIMLIRVEEFLFDSTNLHHSELHVVLPFPVQCQEVRWKTVAKKVSKRVVTALI